MQIVTVMDKAQWGQLTVALGLVVSKFYGFHKFHSPSDNSHLPGGIVCAFVVFIRRKTKERRESFQ